MLKNVVVVLSSLLFLGCQSTQPNKAPSQINAKKSKHQEYLHSGDKLPIDAIKNIDGKKVVLQGSKKQKIVILFATWCPDSNRLIRALNKSPILHDDNIEIIAIARGESKATVSAWRDKLALNVPLAVDEDKSIYKQFASGGIPRIITVNTNNEIIKMNLAEGQEQLSLIEWQ